MEFITYEMFGAAGNGVADDMPAIIRAHEEANKLNLPVKARAGATYYISPRDLTAVVKTDVDWTGAKFIIDDVNCENCMSPCFSVVPSEEPVPFEIKSLVRGQTHLANPTGRELYIVVRNDNHADYIRKGLNRDNGSPRTDAFVLRADGSISSAVSFDFDEVTDVCACPVDQKTITLTGGEFTTIANQAEPKHTYYQRNIHITRSNVEVRNIDHYVTGETDRGAPYGGFLSISCCAFVHVYDCLFTAHYIYQTIGVTGSIVAMGTYDILLYAASSITFSRCSQTTDIMDERYWGLMGSNNCRDLTFEDCVFSRFDAHKGVSNCTLRRCKLGWQCLNAIGHGVFLIEDTDAYGSAFVGLRGDYGSTWRGEMIIRNCTWHPLRKWRSIFSADNPGDHYFGYDCYLPEVSIDGLTIVEETESDAPLSVFNDYTCSAADGQCPYPMIPPKSARVRNIAGGRPVQLCANPALMPNTAFDAE